MITLRTVGVAVSRSYRSEVVKDGTAKFPFSYTVAALYSTTPSEFMNVRAVTATFGSSVGAATFELTKPSESASLGGGSTLRSFQGLIPTNAQLARIPESKNIKHSDKVFLADIVHGT